MFEISIIERTKHFFKEGIEIIKNSDILIEETLKSKYPLIDIISTFRDEYLIRKLIKFFKNISNLSPEEKNKIIKKLQNENVVERVIIAVDRIDTEDKIDYYFKLVKMLCNEEIDTILFYRCCKILENYSYYDINSFSRKSNYSISNEEDILAFSMGLLQNKPQGGLRSDNRGGMLRQPISVLGMSELVLSKAGEIFLKLNNR